MKALLQPKLAALLQKLVRQQGEQMLQLKWTVLLQKLMRKLMEKILQTTPLVLQGVMLCFPNCCLIAVDLMETIHSPNVVLLGSHCDCLRPWLVTRVHSLLGMM